MKNVRAVTPADVQRMARTWLDPARMTVVVVGDPAQVTEQVRPFGEIVSAPRPPLRARRPQEKAAKPRT